MSEKTEWDEKTVYREIAEFLRNNTEYKVLVEGESPEPNLYYGQSNPSYQNWIAKVDIALFEGERLVRIIEFEEKVRPKEFYGVIMASVILSQTFTEVVEFNYVVPDDDKKVKRCNWLLDLMRPALKNYPNVIVKPIIGETQFKAEIGFVTGK